MFCGETHVTCCGFWSAAIFYFKLNRMVFKKQDALIGTTIILILLLIIVLFGFMVPLNRALENWYPITILITIGIMVFGVYLTGAENSVVVEPGFSGVVYAFEKITNEVLPNGEYWVPPFYKIVKVSAKEDTKTKEMILVTLGDQVKVKMFYGYAYRRYNPKQVLSVDESDAFTIIDSKLQMIIEEIFSNPLRPLYAIKIAGKTETATHNVLNMLDEIRDQVLRDLVNPRKGYGGRKNGDWIQFAEYGIQISKINISGGQLVDQNLVNEVAAIMKEQLQREGQQIETQTIVATIQDLILKGMTPELAGQFALVMAGKSKVNDINWFGLLGKATGADAWLFGNTGSNPNLLVQPKKPQPPKKSSK